MVTYCDKCFETGDHCRRADDTSLTCVNIPDASSLHLSDGSYDAQLQAATTALAGITPSHIDALLAYTPSSGGTSPLSTEETTLLASSGNVPAFDLLDMNNLQVGVTLASKRPAHYEALKTRMLGLLVLGNSAVQVAKVEAAIKIMTEDRKSAIDAGKASAISTAAAYKENHYPLYQLWHKTLKKSLDGLDLAEEVDQKTLFDTTTGKPYVPFEKMPKCKTPAHLFRAWSLFKEAVTVLHSLAPRAWSGLESQIYRAEASVGFLIAQQFVGEVLRRLDAKEYVNIAVLLRAGEHNRILDDLRPPGPPAAPGGPGKEGQKRVKLGPVTKQGEFTSLIRNSAGQPLPCNQHKKGEPCTAGVAAGQGLDAHVGKCAYHHA